MPIEIKMPALSPTMEEGTIAKWLVKEGDKVVSGDLIAEIETDKATMEFEAVDEGIIARITVPEGEDSVKVGTVIAIIAEEGEDVAAAAASANKADAAPSKQAQPATANNTEQKAESSKADSSSEMQAKPQLSTDNVVKASTEERIKASPLARRIAGQAGLDLHDVAGSGPRGRIIRADVEAALLEAPSAKAGQQAISEPVSQGQAASATTASSEIPHEAIRLSNMRKTIARRLTESKQTVPHFYLTVDCKLDALLALRTELNAGLEARGIKLSVNDFLIKALAVALVEVPNANVQFAGDSLLKFSRADISMAVAIEGGLITPVIADAANKPLSRIATEAKDLAARARDGQLRPEEYQGGTASISNLGMFGIKQFDAVINPPQAMIMAVGAGEKRPYIIDDKVKAATIITATGSFDHRAIDGAVGAELMQAFKRLVEHPIAMLA